MFTNKVELFNLYSLYINQQFKRKGGAQFVLVFSCKDRSIHHGTLSVQLLLFFKAKLPSVAQNAVHPVYLTHLRCSLIRPFCLIPYIPFIQIRGAQFVLDFQLQGQVYTSRYFISSLLFHWNTVLRSFNELPSVAQNAIHPVYLTHLR